MNVDPRWLAQRIRKGTAAGAGAADQFTEVIDSDAPCGKCGYNLRGLKIPGNCPECGTPVGIHARPATVHHGPAQFHALPLPELKRIGLLGGSMCTALAVMALGWLFLYIYIVVVYCGGPLIHPLLAGALGAWVFPAALVMMLGLWGTLFNWGAAAVEGKAGLAGLVPLSTPARWSFAALGAAWPIAAVCHAVSACLGGGSDTWGLRFQLAGVGFSVLGALALGPICKLMSDLAALADDDFAVNRMRTAVVGAPVLAIILALSPFWAPLASEGGGLGALVISGISIPLLVPQLFFLAGAFSLGRTLRWAAHNARGAIAREQRFIERSLREAAHPGTRLVRD